MVDYCQYCKVTSQTKGKTKCIDNPELCRKAMDVDEVEVDPSKFASLFGIQADQVKDTAPKDPSKDFWAHSDLAPL